MRDDKLYESTVIEKDNYREIKRVTEDYLFKNETFDKSKLFNELNSRGLVELKEEGELFSIDSEHIDSDFDISKRTLTKHYKRIIQVSKKITIVAKNYLESRRDDLLIFDEKNKLIKVIVDDDFFEEVKEGFKSE